jgi:vancomycin resistance protein YoaR
VTTLRQSLPSALQGVGGGAVGRLALAFLLTLIAIAVFATAFALGYARLHDGRIVPGVEVAGVSLSGLDPLQAEAQLREALPSVSDGHLNVRVAEVEERIAFSEFGRDYDIALMVQQALSVGRSSDALAQAREQLNVLLNGVTIEPSLTWNGEQLASLVGAAAATAYIEPIDAQVVAQRGGYVVEPAHAGRAVDVEEAVALSHAAVSDLAVSEASVTLQPLVLQPAISTAEAEAAVAQFEMVTGEALTVLGPDMRATIGAHELRGWTRIDESAPGTWSVIIEREPLVQFAAMQALEIDQPPISATFAFEEDAVVAVGGQEGRAVDVEASANAMLAALETRMNGAAPGEVNLAMTIVQPEFTSEEATDVASRMEELGRWRTNYQPGPLNYRGANIRIPTEKIDGTILEPGDTFDFWDVVGYPTVEEGYGPGAAIIRGRTVPDGALAGGICSGSTTIFNAAMRAGLEMGDRRNHHYYINRYPVGLDATVWISDSGQRQTVSFTNDMEHPIFIRGINRRAAVIFEVWGVPDGREVHLSKPTITNRERAEEETRESSSLRPGERRRVEWPADGFNSSVTRTVRDASGNVLHRDTFTSRYATINGITLVGTSASRPSAPEEEP